MTVYAEALNKDARFEKRDTAVILDLVGGKAVT